MTFDVKRRGHAPTTRRLRTTACAHNNIKRSFYFHLLLLLFRDPRAKPFFSPVYFSTRYYAHIIRARVPSAGITIAPDDPAAAFYFVVYYYYCSPATDLSLPMDSTSRLLAAARSLVYPSALEERRRAYRRVHNVLRVITQRVSVYFLRTDVDSYTNAAAETRLRDRPPPHLGPFYNTIYVNIARIIIIIIIIIIIVIVVVVGARVLAPPPRRPPYTHETVRISFFCSNQIYMIRTWIRALTIRCDVRARTFVQRLLDTRLLNSTGCFWSTSLHPYDPFVSLYKLNPFGALIFFSGSKCCRLILFEYYVHVQRVCIATIRVNYHDSTRNAIEMKCEQIVSTTRRGLLRVSGCP